MREHHIPRQIAGSDVHIIKLLPPLIIEDGEVEMIVSERPTPLFELW